MKTPIRFISKNSIYRLRFICLCFLFIGFSTYTFAETPPPIVEDREYCVGDIATALTAEGENLLWYTSETGGEGVDIAPTPNITIPGTSEYWVSQTINQVESERARIVVTVIMDCECGASATPFTINSTHGSSICESEQTVLSPSIQQANATDFEFIWYKGNHVTGTIVAGPIVNVNSFPYTVTMTEETEIYTLVVSSRYASHEVCKKYASITLEQIECPEPTYTLSGGGTFCSGETITPVTITLTGTPPFSITYSIDGITQTPITNITTTTRVLGNTPGVYRLIAISDANESGLVGADSVSIKIYIPPAPTVTTPIQYCTGATATPLSANGQLGAIFLWYTAETGGMGLITTPTPNTSVAGTLSYWVSQKVNGCEGPRTELNINIHPTPIVSVTANQTEIFVGEISTLTATVSPSAAGGIGTWAHATKISETTASLTAETVGVIHVSYNFVSAQGCQLLEPVITTITVIANKSQLESYYNEALIIQNKVQENELVVGELPGQIPAELYDEFELALSHALSLLDDDNASQEDIEDAVDMLRSYIEEIEQQQYYIIVTKDIPSQSLEIGVASQNFLFADYIIHDSESIISYTITSSAPTIVQAVQVHNTFGLVPYAAGEAVVTIIVSSNTGREAILEFTVTVNAQAQANCPTLTISPAIQNVSCFNGNNGSVTIAVSGGTAPYTYKWSNTRSDNRITNVRAGTYSVLVVDADGCSHFEEFVVQQPSEITITPTIQQPTCGNADGSVSVIVEGGTAPYTYLWSDNSQTASFSDKDAGLYSLTVSDSRLCTKSSWVELSNAAGPEIMINAVTPTACNPNNGAIVLDVSGGTGNLSFEWNDGNTAQNRSELAAGRYSITVTDESECKAVKDITVPSIPFLQPEIALVTVSQETGNNLIVWLKEETSVVDYYSIYREIAQSGEFALIGQHSYTLLSVYEDIEVDPQIQSWRYRISATDFCGNESPISAARYEFKTINLQITEVGNTVQLDWDQYEGIDVYRYIIYSKNALGEWLPLDTVPANVYQYSTIPTIENYGYYVAAELHTEIDPKILLQKVESGPFSLAMSNIAEAETETLDTEIVSKESIHIYPTEINITVNIVLPNGSSTAHIIITTIGGKEVLNVTTQKTHTEIPTDELSSGMYILTVSTEAIQKSVVVVKK